MDIQRNVVTLALAKGAKLNVRAVPAAVEAAGFKPRWLWVRSLQDGGKPCVWRLDTRLADPSWEVESRDLEEALRVKGRAN